ncbi:hypothetical protein [Thermococcus cleftensis]|nr:hypothetical protein [Thermococcus cleftensis]
MDMDEEARVLRDYLTFTVPHITVLAGAILGILMIIGVPVRTALGIFAIAYGLMLTVLGLIIRPHVSGNLLYRLTMAFFVGLVAVGAFLLLRGG